MRINDTIAAISTALSEGGIGIVRISGENSVEIADRIYKGKEKLINVSTHTIHYGHIYYKEEIIDEVLVSVMRAPRSFTGEDTVEINCHGGVIVVQKVLEAVLGSGAYLAQPGEFTKRAFLNGKIDLSQAEAVIDIIEAKNDYALQSGMSQLQGKLKSRISDLTGRILTELAYIEAALDDPEHYSLDGHKEVLECEILRIRDEIQSLIKSYQNGSVIKEGINTVIIGRPNAGKSSLLNLLLGKERAIVTDIAGTTRDILTEHLKLSGISLNLSDTAGIRSSDDFVENIGVNMAKEAAKNADFILCVLDASRKLGDEDIEILRLIRDKKAIILLNKMDLEPVLSEDEIKKYSDKEVIAFSAMHGIGLSRMENTIKQMFIDGELNFNDQVYVTNIRHRNALSEADSFLGMVINSICSDMPEDFYSIDLYAAYESLKSITGEGVVDDVINEVFSKFCMGK